MNLELIGYIAAIVSIIGVFLNARKIIWCWPVWITSNSLWLAYSIISMQIPMIILWSVFTLSNLYGWFKWLPIPYQNKIKKLWKQPKKK